MMWPLRRAIISGSASWQPVDHAVQVDFDRGADRLLGLFEERPDRHHPALLISTSMWPPPSVRALSRNVANDSRSVTSSG